MAQPYPARQGNQDEALGLLLIFLVACVAGSAYLATTRFHLAAAQCEEAAFYLIAAAASLTLVVVHLTGRRRKREENWPQPALAISSKADGRALALASKENGTLLGYTIHNEPWIWPDGVRMRHGILLGGSGAGKTTNLLNIIRQDLHRSFDGRRMPMIILNGKGDTDFEREVMKAAEEAGRTQDLRVLNPSRPLSSVRYNPFYAVDDNYQEHVNFIFGSFGLREDFFKGHQEAYLSDLVRILHYTGKRFNIYDVLVMALDEAVLRQQVEIATERIRTLPGLTAQKRQNFDMSIRMVQRSFADRERIEKIQGLLNELLAFLEDDLSIVTGAYQDLLTLDDVLDQNLVLLVSLNTNANERAVEALGKILLQNLRLMVGKRYSRDPEPDAPPEPMVSVILDEFESFAYPGFANVLQTARGARISILFAFQMLSQMQKVSPAFAEEVASAPQTKMIMNVSEESTVQWFMKASARVNTKRRSLAVRKTGLFTTRYIETGTGNESEVKETRAREDQIKNLPTGQMQILMVDSREGTRFSHLLVRHMPMWQLDGMHFRPYPKMRHALDPQIGANLRFTEEEKNPRRRRRTAGVFGE